MAVGVTQEYSLAGVGSPVDPRRPETTQRSFTSVAWNRASSCQRGVGRIGPTIRRRLTLKELHPGPGPGSKRGDSDPGAGQAAETFALATQVLSATMHLESKPLTLEAQ